MEDNNVRNHHLTFVSVSFLKRNFIHKKISDFPEECIQIVCLCLLALYFCCAVLIVTQCILQDTDGIKLEME